MNILKLNSLQYALILENGSLNKDLTLKIKTLMSHTKPQHAKLHQTLEEKLFFFDPECT